MLTQKLKISLALLRQRYVTESIIKMELVVCVCVLLTVLFYAAGYRRKAMKFGMQAHRSTRQAGLKRWLCQRFIRNNLYLCGYDNELSDSQRQKVEGWVRDRIIVLKKNDSSGEKGVLLIKFTPVLEVLPRALDMTALLQDYTLVIEPSWSGICQPEVLQFSRYAETIHVMAPEECDYEFIDMLSSNLKPMRLGPGDWVGAGDLYSSSGATKKFDIVMNSNWGAWKRHYVLFNALSKMPNSIRVALIGFPLWGEGRDKVERLAKYFRVESQITMYEGVSHSEVMKIVAESRIGTLMSLKEGANKSISECILSGVPVVLLDTHVGGARGKINSLTGRFSSERELANTLQKLMLEIDVSAIQQWGLENISSRAATVKLNEILKSTALQSDQLWTVDIVEKRNSPELDYAIESDRARFADVNLQNFRVN